MSISSEDNQNLKVKFENYKNDLSYIVRENQFQNFVPIAQEIIHFVLNKNDFKQEYLDAFIQLFKNGCSSNSAEKYLKLLNVDQKLKNNFLTLIKNKITGYTAAGMATTFKGKRGSKGIKNIIGSNELKKIKLILTKASKCKNKNTRDEVVKEITDISNQIENFSHGVYSPILFYLNPSYFPIFNGQLTNFKLKTINSYSEFIEIADKICKYIKIEKEKDKFSILDGFLLNLNTHNSKPTDDSSKPNFNNNNNMSLNTILYGPPGTGKTYNTINKAVDIVASDIEIQEIKKQDGEDKRREKEVELFKQYAGIEEKKNSLFNQLKSDKVNQIEFVTFHQNYTYEDFVIGLKPNTENDNNLTFKENYGIFYRICKEAYHNQDKNYVLIIDEINRANISRVFGELITLLEDDKRIGKENELIVTLPNGEAFGVPPNLYIIGTMNTADKSIALIDIALRRRFEFEPKFPEPDKLKKEDADLLKIINKNIINQGKSADFTIGHAFFMKKMTTIDVIKQKIIPLLMEYFNNNTTKVEDVFNATEFVVKYLKESFEWNVMDKPKPIVLDSNENNIESNE